jgi:hypothetical protein
MFVKSCNCNSSIATRVGFAVGSYVNSSRVLCLFFLDHILPKLDVSMAHEVTSCDTANREVELRLHQDGLCW